MNWLKLILGGRHADAEKAMLIGQTVTERRVMVPVKNAHYHEIVGQTVRIYHRETGLVHEQDGCENPIGTALSLLKQYNGGAS